MSAFTDTDYERVVRERDEALARVDSQRSQIAFYRTACTARFLPEGFGDDAMRELIKELTEDLDEARAEVERLREMAHDFEAMREDRDGARAERDAAIARITEVGVMIATNGNRLAKDAYRRGAEAMREACAAALMAYGLVLSRERAAKVVRAQPIPEEP